MKTVSIFEHYLRLAQYGALPPKRIVVGHRRFGKTLTYLWKHCPQLREEISNLFFEPYPPR